MRSRPLTRRTVRPTRRLAGASLGLLLVATACGDSDDGDATAATVTVTGAAAVTATTDAGAAPSATRASLFEVLDDPRMVAAADATWLDDDAVVMGVVHRGEAQAFPIDQMAYHHIANTRIAGEPYLVTY